MANSGEKVIVMFNHASKHLRNKEHNGKDIATNQWYDWLNVEKYSCCTWSTHLSTFPRRNLTNNNALSPGQTDSQVAASWTCEETCVGSPNGKKLALTCGQIWSRPKWSQVNASARKAWPNGVASRPKFSTCDYLRVRLTRALHFWNSIDNASPHEINLSFSTFTGNPFVSIKWIHTSPVSYNAINLEYSQNAKSAAKFYFKSDNFGCSISLRLTNSVFSNNRKQGNSNCSRIGSSSFVRLSCHDTWVS